MIRLNVDPTFEREVTRIKMGFVAFSAETLDNWSNGGIWKFLENEVRKEVKNKFESEGGRRRWAALEPRYAEWKERNYPNTSILFRSGRLKLAATGESGEWVSRQNRLSYEYGVRGIPYAAIHMFGGRIRPVPRETLIRIPQADGPDVFSKGRKGFKIKKRDYLTLSLVFWAKMNIEMAKLFKNRLVDALRGR